MADSAYRPPGDDRELSTLLDILSECFSFPRERGDARVPIVGKDNIRVLVEDGAVVSGLWQVPMGHYYGGRSVPVIGIAAVGVPPEQRGKGVANRLMDVTVRECHERGIALSSLFPATQTLYRKSGYELAGDWNHTTILARNVLVRDRVLEVRKLEENDHDAAAEVYASVARLQPGYLDRGNYIWQRIRHPVLEEKPAYAYGAFRDGTLEGYTYFTHKMEAHGYDLTVLDLQFTTGDAGRRLLTLLGDHSSMGNELRWSSGPSDAASLLLPEQTFQRKTKFSWMLRITHVKNALEARGYPEGLEAELHFRVTDPAVPANGGDYVLHVADGSGTVKEGGRGDIECDVRGLASLYSGYATPWKLEMARLLTAPEAAKQLAQSVFCGPAPGMADQF